MITGKNRGHSHTGVDLSSVSNVERMLRAIKIGVALNLTIFALDIAVWYFLTPSVAIFSGSLHNLLHAAIWAAAYWGISLENAPPNAKHTYGQKRKQVLASTLIALLLIFTALLMWIIGSQRIIHPGEVIGQFVIVMAAADLATNIFLAWIINGQRKKSQDYSSVKGVLWDVRLDILGAIAVLVNGLAISMFAFYMADGIAAIVIGVVSLFAAADMLKDTLPILNESVPKDIRRAGGTEAIESFIANFHGFRMPHDLHIWNVGEHDIYLTCHVAHHNIRHLDEHRDELVHELHHKFGINHTTIQIESVECALKCEADSRNNRGDESTDIQRHADSRKH